MSSWKDIRAHFRYIRPEAAITGTAFADGLRGCTLAVLDGVTEAMSLQGCDDMQGAGIAEFSAAWTRPLADRGMAVLALDHVVKDEKARNRYAIGSIHKLNAVTGASYILVNREPFGRGMLGRSELLVSKDRPGYVRQHGVPVASGLVRIAELSIDAHGKLAVSLGNPDQFGATFRPTILMERISRALEQAAGPLSKRRIREGVQGNNKAKELAVTLLVEEGFASLEIRGKTHLIGHLKPYRHEDEDD